MEPLEVDDNGIALPVRPPKLRPVPDAAFESYDSFEGYDSSSDFGMNDSKILQILLNSAELAIQPPFDDSLVVCRQCGSRDHPSWKCKIKNVCPICSQDESSSAKRCNAVMARTWSSHSKSSVIDPSKVSTTIRIILQKGHRPTPIIYSSLISAYISRRRADSAELVLEKMKKDGIPPDSICYNAVLDAWCEIGNMDKALKVLIDMRSAGCSSTISTYNTVIKGLGIAGKLDEALKLLKRMSRSNPGNVRPNLRSYNIMLNAYCEKGKIEEARKVIGLMKAAGLSPDVISYNTLIKAFGRAKKPEMAEEIVREMQNAYLRPNERTFGLVVRSYCDLGRMDEACAMVENMRMYGATPNTVVFNILIKGYVQASQPGLAEKILDMMKEFNVKPDIASYSTVMNAWCSVGKPFKAKKVLNRMKSGGISPDVEVFSVLAKGYLRARMGKEAEDILTEMEEANLKPNVVTYTTIISCYCSCGGKMDDAMRVYGKMVATGVKANIFTYRTLIWGFSESRNPTLAEKMLSIMEAAGVSPDARCYDQVSIAWQSVGLWKEAERINHLKRERLEKGPQSMNLTVSLCKRTTRERPTPSSSTSPSHYIASSNGKSPNFKGEISVSRNKRENEINSEIERRSATFESSIGNLAPLHAENSEIVNEKINYGPFGSNSEGYDDRSSINGAVLENDISVPLPCSVSATVVKENHEAGDGKHNSNNGTFERSNSVKAKEVKNGFRVHKKLSNTSLGPLSGSKNPILVKKVLQPTSSAKFKNTVETYNGSGNSSNGNIKKYDSNNNSSRCYNESLKSISPKSKLAINEHGNLISSNWSSAFYSCPPQRNYLCYFNNRRPLLSSFLFKSANYLPTQKLGFKSRQLSSLTCTSLNSKWLQRGLPRCNHHRLNTNGRHGYRLFPQRRQGISVRSVLYYTKHSIVATEHLCRNVSCRVGIL